MNDNILEKIAKIEEQISNGQLMAAPENEPERQYYFIAKLKEYVSKTRESIGRPLTACTKTFGCQMNARDSEKLEGILKIIGYEPTESEKADFVIYNTCTVRENANLRVYGRLGQLKSKKRKNPHMMIGLCGCMMQEAHVVEKIRKSYKFVDLVFGTHNIYKFAELLYDRVSNESMIIDIWEDTDKIVEELPIERKFPFKSGVNIMFGCNNFCSYCIVPYVRGRERSREPELILEEVKGLAKEGYKEITLLGQNVNSYKGNEKIRNFAELLNEVCKIDGIERVNFISPHPKDFTDDVIEVIANNEKVTRIVHLPVQSGNTKVLKEMNRKYTKEQYLELAKKMLSKIPGLVLSTDIIVGFPGETDEEFEDTLDVVRQINFEQIFMFIYSVREGTVAAERQDQVPEEIKHIRFNKLKELYESRVDENNEKYLNTVQKLLIEGKSKNNENMLEGRTSTNKVVIFEPHTEKKPGDIVSVKITETHKWYLKGEIIND